MGKEEEMITRVWSFTKRKEKKREEKELREVRNRFCLCRVYFVRLFFDVNFEPMTVPVNIK